jgi:hypothetical protein
MDRTERQDRETAERPKRDLADTVRSSWRRIQGRDGRVGPKAPIAEGGPGASPGGTDSGRGPGLARGSTSAVLARVYKPRASGEPKARPLTGLVPQGAGGHPVAASTFISLTEKTERRRRQDFREERASSPSSPPHPEASFRVTEISPLDSPCGGIAAPFLSCIMKAHKITCQVCVRNAENCQKYV